MTRGFTIEHIRVGHLAAPHTKRVDSACTTGGFYTSPSGGQTIDASKPLKISWDASCLDTQMVDIYLYAPGEATPLVHEWENVSNSPGSYTTTLQAAWWNSSASTNLQLSIVQSGTPIFLSPAPAGPVFVANYTGSSSANSSPPDVTDVQKIEADLKAMSSGHKAVAVLLPLLLIIGLGVAYYFRVSRKKGQEKRKRWSEALDKRMSTVSTDWKPMSAAGANAAIRASMVGNRASVFSFGAIRPDSEHTLDGGNAGVGAQGMHDDIEFDPSQQMSQLRSGPRPVLVGQRVSRVSFAADPRPSTDRRTVVSRAYHNAFVPPTPGRKDSGELSPTQTHGPLSLSEEDISARVSGVDSVDDYMPALNMMRTGTERSTDEDEYIIPRTKLQEDNFELPIPPTPTHPSTSPKVPATPTGVTPDEMLRAYARSRVASPPGSPAPGNISLAYPAPVAANGGMRMLYSPATPATPVSVPGSETREMHHAYAYSQHGGEDHEDAYGGTAP